MVREREKIMLVGVGELGESFSNICVEYPTSAKL